MSNQKTISHHLAKSEHVLKQADIPSSRLDAELLLAHALQVPREYLLAHGDQVLTDSEMALLDEYISRRLSREPLCYITGTIEFYGLELAIDKRALSPRVETETIVEQVISQTPQNAELIDIGTGSGAIAIAIAKHRPDIHVTATEVSAEALSLAQENARTILGADHTIAWLTSDIFDNVEATYDVVVTNLPYLVTNSNKPLQPEVDKEPHVALFGGEDDGLGLYRRFYHDVPKHTRDSSLVYHESDPWQHEALHKLARAAGFENIFEGYFILGFKRL